MEKQKKKRETLEREGLTIEGSVDKVKVVAPWKQEVCRVVPRRLLLAYAHEASRLVLQRAPTEGGGGVVGVEEVGKDHGVVIRERISKGVPEKLERLCRTALHLDIVGHAVDDKGRVSWG